MRHLNGFLLLLPVLTLAQIYAPDPAVAKMLKDLPLNRSLLLPPVHVACGDLTMHGMNQYGPGGRDYCNKMVYAPERKTALYAGGNHQSPHRMNDVWEYHLASNTWHLLYEPDGGNAGKHKAAYFLTSRSLVKDPDMILDEKQQASIAVYKSWWEEHVQFKQGDLTTTRGGPIMPAHTWDGFCYDARAKKMLWGMGASPASQISTHASFTGTSMEQLEQQVDSHLTPMWMFDPDAKRWQHYRTETTRPPLRGMGASLTYLPDFGKSIWYTAAQNVSPHAYEMWMFDAVADTWSELKPNGGRTLSKLVQDDQLAPGSELQSAYAPRHRKLVAVHHHNTFIYDLERNEWSLATTDERIYGHDAYSIFVYDDKTDTFLLLYSPRKNGKALQLAAFDLDTKKWELVDIQGPLPIPPKYGNTIGYYDVEQGLFVAQGRYTQQVWVYRHGRN